MDDGGRMRCLVVMLVLYVTSHAGDVDVRDEDVMGDAALPAIMASSQLAATNTSTVTDGSAMPAAATTTEVDDLASCPTGGACTLLPAYCITCYFDRQCVYGQLTTAACSPKTELSCTGERNFTRNLECRYCYQTASWEQQCTISTECRAVAAPPQRYRANCTVNNDVLCIGRRKFYKMFQCNWTSGYRWSTALALSITLGGFGVDRFYLGLWREGIGKLFSFGGLGVWTLVDVILIATGYVGPADGSLYIF